MIEEVQTLWRQLNGPQAVAFVRSIFAYFKDAYDDNLDYLNGLNIETANEQHLNFIGKLMGIRRPIVQSESYSKLLYFSDNLQSNDSQGLAKVYTDVDGQGGFFDTTDGFSSNENADILPIEDYRFLLKVVSEQEGSFRSLVLIDKIVSQFIPETITYKLSYHPTISGDIVVTLSSTAPYRTLLAKIVLNLFFSTVPTVHFQVEE